MTTSTRESQVSLPARVYHDVNPDPFAPLSPGELRIVQFLLEHNYDVLRIRSILDHARTWGSVECCALLDDLNRSAVENLLPMASVACWRQYPGYWTVVSE
jgi:hypothetical protein